MIRGKETYDVFVRDWWRRPERGEPAWRDPKDGELKVPYPGAPRRYIARGVSYEEAREICAEYNATHDAGWRSRKAEFESAD